MFKGTIISGGQSGVDRAALDVALALGIPCGGWCPKGRLAEDGPIALRYPLKETPGAEYSERTRRNVQDSDGTLVLTLGAPADGTALTIELAEAAGKPWFVVDFEKGRETGPVVQWIVREEITVLNVAGPRESKSPGIYDLASSFLAKVLVNSL